MFETLFDTPRQRAGPARRSRPAPARRAAPPWPRPARGARAGRAGGPRRARAAAGPVAAPTAAAQPDEGSAIQIAFLYYIHVVYTNAFFVLECRYTLFFNLQKKYKGVRYFMKCI